MGREGWVEFEREGEGEEAQRMLRFRKDQLKKTLVMQYD